MDLVGETLGQFQIIEELGKGGMAVVYKAYQANLQRHVAIKVLSPKLTDDVDLVKRFLREARSAAALHHSNVIVIHDADPPHACGPQINGNGGPESAGPGNEDFGIF